MVESIEDRRHPYPCAKNVVLPVPRALDVLNMIKNKEIESDALVLKDDDDDFFTIMYRFKKL